MSLTPLAKAIKDCFEPVQKYEISDSSSHEGEHSQHENAFVDFESQVTNDEIIKRLTVSPDFCARISYIIVEALSGSASNENMFSPKDVDDSVYETAADELMDRLHF